MKNGKLFLDDIRIPKDAITLVPLNFNRIYWENDWDIVRNYDEFVTYIKTKGIPELISFDHDLADEHYNDIVSNKNRTKDDSNVELEYTEKTGLECAKFLVDYCADKKLQLPQCIVHSANPIGKKNIELFLENVKKHLFNSK